MAAQVTSGRIRAIVGIVLAFGFIFQCQQALSERNTAQQASPSPKNAPDPGMAYAAPVREVPAVTLTPEQLAAQDPIAFFEAAIEQYDRSVRDYTCTFTKQELIGDEMSEEQVMRAMFREKPYSVRLEWIKNPDKANRVLYVADRWVEDGKQMAVVEPGAIARLFVSYVMRPIHGPDAAKSSRRSIDQFGVRNSMVLTVKYAKIAKARGVLEKFEFVGNGKVAGRDTLIFERRLPYTGERGAWPDRTLIVHLDKEHRLPTLCEAYADVERNQLLGRYQFTDIQINPNLADSVFTTHGMGL